MKPNLGTFVITLLASTFATAGWSQGLGRVHFETSCTPQAQEKFDRGLAMVHTNWGRHSSDVTGALHPVAHYQVTPATLVPSRLS